MRGWCTIWIAGIFTFLGTAASGDTIVVTPSDSYELVEGARPGDEVVISPGVYSFRVYLTQPAPPDAPIVIHAMDPSDPPVWDLSGTYVEDAPGSYVKVKS